MGLQKAYEIAMVNGDYQPFKEAQAAATVAPSAIVKLDAGVVTTPDTTPSKAAIAPRYALCPPTLFIRIAAFLGASAVTLGAYGAHVLKPVGSMATVFHTANLYHFLHTLVLFTVSFSRYPRLTGTLLILGIIIFSGTCYLHVFTENPQWVQATPYGGMLLIAAWTSFLL